MNSTRLFLSLVLVLVVNVGLTQNQVKFKGIVTDILGKPLSDSYVHVANQCLTTDNVGKFTSEYLKVGVYEVTISHIGYQTENYRCKLVTDSTYVFALPCETYETEAVTIQADHNLHIVTSEARNLDFADATDLRLYNSGSLMQTLEYLPGVSSLSIGSGQSKPIIRGMAFNRVSVFEDGIKHESQQWGADHGLEIDQLSAEHIQIIKGPGALEYGSDALGGVIEIKSSELPREGTHTLKITDRIQFLNFYTDERMTGGAAWLYRKKKFAFGLDASFNSYNDYRVPTDSIQYYSYYFRLKNNQVRNTAGYEYTLKGSAGYIGKYISSNLIISNIQSKSGFFANAHGLEIRTSRINYDTLDTDIDLPYQDVRHLKIANNTLIHPGGANLLTLDLAWQNNIRQEYTEPTEHGWMPLPPDSLERKFAKNTLSSNLKWSLPNLHGHEIKMGISSEYQHNRIGGWGFIMPEYQQIASGVFIKDKFVVTHNQNLHAGLRFDFAQIRIGSYYDWYQSPELINGATELVYLQRSADTIRTFSSPTWMLGYNLNKSHVRIRANIGKSFRIPGAKELAARGINYHFYQYEAGNIQLKAEKSYQADVGFDTDYSRFDLSFTPFVNYFPNYIYLNPGGGYEDGLLRFEYTETKVFRFGSELSLRVEFYPNFSYELAADYLYSEQLSGQKVGFGLPFAPPPTVAQSLVWDAFYEVSYHIELKHTYRFRQNRIVPPEIITPASHVFDIYAGILAIKSPNNKHALNIYLQLNNVFNTKYWQHTNYYRLIDLPEPSRTFGIMMEWKFSLHQKK